MQELVQFAFDGYPLRATKNELGRPWIVAKDAMEILGFDTSNIKQILDVHLDDDEKGRYSIPTLGGTQEMWCVSESGLYVLIIRSNKPKAKEFRRWVTHEVLPVILRGESYSLPFDQPATAAVVPINRDAPLSPSLPPSVTLKQIDEATNHAIRIVKRIPGLTDTSQQARALNNMVKRHTGADVLEMAGITHLVCEDQRRHYSVTELGKMVNPPLSAVKLNRLLEDQGFQVSSRDSKNNIIWTPTEKAAGHWVLTDTGKAHSTSGSSIQQVRWYESILAELVFPAEQTDATAG